MKTKVVFFDGSCLANGTEDAVASAAFYDPQTSEQGMRLLSYKPNTNNRAEYQGLIMAIQHAYKSGYKDVCFKGDSKLVVEQMLGNWKVKDFTLGRMRETALASCRTFFDSFTFEWVPREDNPADEVAAKATGRK